MSSYQAQRTVVSQRAFVDIVRQRAANEPSRTAFIFVGEEEERSRRLLTYQELDRRAKRIAVWLENQGLRGERVLIAQPHNLDYVAALLGCFYAGSIAVPVYAPKLNKHFERLSGIISDARPAIALANRAILAKVRATSNRVPALQELRWHDVEEMDENHDDWMQPEIAEGQTALLQYTSGSTGSPKGVVVSYENLAANQSMIQEAFKVTESSVIVGWLPLYHDMGLIGNVLQPLWTGALCVLMSPAAFLQRPVRWLQLISENRGTISGAPNFAYDLCCRKVTAEERAQLDLSSWQIAFNGSEPVRAETLERFTRTFGPSGFQRSAWFPCYGLAEATLFVAGGNEGGFPRVESSRVGEPQAHRAYNGDGIRKESTVVSCGRGGAAEKIVIVDPETLAPCRPYQVGEVWVAGKNVAQGYWNQPQSTRETFQAFLKDKKGPFLRTGDLGFLSEDDQYLFITGRSKDLIIIRGCNHYPQDLEYTLQNSHSAFSGGSAAAFCLEVNGEIELAILQEVVTRDKGLDFGGLIETAVRAVAEEHGLRAYVALVKGGTLPRTTSGKIRRSECKRQFLENSLVLLGDSRAPFSLTTDLAEQNGPSPDRTQYSHERQDVAETLRNMVAHVIGLPPPLVAIDKPLTALGLDSLQAGELKAAISDQWQIDLPWEMLLKGPPITELVVYVLAGLDSEQRSQAVHHVPTEADSIYSLSFGQRALWFLYKLAPANAVYNVPAALRIRNAIDRSKLRAAFQMLVDHHSSLRTVFEVGENGPMQRIISHVDVPVTFILAETWTAEELRERMTAEAARPFILERAPLFRIMLFATAGGESVLLFLVHHIITDFHSLVLLLQDLGSLYSSLKDGYPTQLPGLSPHYSSFVAWQRDFLEGPRGDELRKRWLNQLQGELPTVKLPLDHPWPPVQTYEGSACSFNVNQELTNGVMALAQTSGVTIYTLLAAVFMTLLHLYSSQENIVMGTSVSGRTQKAWSRVIGYLINQVVLLGRYSGNPKFSDFLEQMRHMVAFAIAHQDYPLALVADQLHPNRSTSHAPLFQTMFAFHKAGPGQPAELAALALGVGGYRCAIGDLQIESMPLANKAAQLDLTFMMAQVNDQFSGSIQYNVALFEASTIERMAGHFMVLLENVVRNAASPVGELALLTLEEEKQLVYNWNQTAMSFDAGLLAHHLFELQAAKSAERTALVSEGRAITYGELEQRANQLAYKLISLGAGPDTVIGLCMERSAELVISMMGILKAGAAYVPIDPTHPAERIEYVLSDAQVKLMVTQESLVERMQRYCAAVICLDSNAAMPETHPPRAEVMPGHLAYLIYTSASTGKPKGVMISHRSLANFLHGIDRVIDCGPEDTLLAVTSVAFDISVMELIWPLTRGAKVVIGNDPFSVFSRPAPAPVSRQKTLEHSLFYFANAGGSNAKNKYRLLLEGAKYADKNGFAAVWTPERHFHEFGGLYPNPAVTSAAVAAVTERIQIRAGSVVLPLHNVLRVAEEWSVVDNLSGGRTGIAFASGWHADDFAFAPQNYSDRKEITFRSLETFMKLWRGEAAKVISGSGKEIDVRIFPQPIQTRPPVWITAAGTAETFIRAGAIGANVLTHLLGQTIEELAGKIRLYREALARAGHEGHVTLMLHTLIGDNNQKVKDTVRGPFTEYLRSSVDLIRNLATSANLPVTLDRMSARDMDDLLAFAFDRYFNSSALFGTVSNCLPMVEQLRQAGADEIACLVDFGVDADTVLAGMSGIAALQHEQQRPIPPVRHSNISVKQLLEEHRPTLMQCTPTMLRMLEAGMDGFTALQCLRTLMLGGEPLPSSLAKAVKSVLSCRLVNMYGPTETTIWSSTDDVCGEGSSISAGRPMANTRCYILEPLHGRLAPIGVVGELFIGGEGLARGYFKCPELTAEKLTPDPFSGVSGARLYSTGDLACYLPDGRIDLLGRNDSQVKIRGVRIELAEIEAALVEHPKVKQVVVVAHQSMAGETAGEKELFAYVVVTCSEPPQVATLRAFLKTKLPEIMVPSDFMFLDRLPVNANGKIDRKSLPAPKKGFTNGSVRYEAPANEVELMLVEVWKQVLGREIIGIDDNFFDLGGHSLRLVQVQGQLARKLGQDFPLVKLLEYPTIRSLAANLTDHASESHANENNHENGTDRAVQQRQALRRQRDAFNDVRRSIQ